MIKIKELAKMNKRKNKSKKNLMVVILVVALSVIALISENSVQNLQKTFAENTTTYKIINPNQSTNKEFWINTVHFDGNTNLNPGTNCDTCAQNAPLHPAEHPPANSTIPVGGGFRLTEPNKVGAWDFRSFTFSPDQIVVNQGDKVTLHFIAVQGAHHVISVGGVDTFELVRGQIHTVSLTANNPGTITYICHVHLPNMVGQILVLPKTAA